ncbi:MAG: 2-C-methyl-D-erythritol 2,4-cyclodiphosphate synthase [Candidatus Aminicenantes bacterium]|nr:2-C-methyl-D-erythritol 2,4-cyclodiphosphate synthase [Candidatus Aminicenantes bacterium]
MFKVGFGYDRHRLAAGWPFRLGGVEIPAERGPVGHSDGDALIHALVDALLGALGEGDIGRLFPDTDPRFRGASSLGFLADVMGRVKAAGWKVENVDTVTVVEEPRVAPHVERIKDVLCPVLGLERSALGIKAKSAEGLGEVGEGRALDCWAVVLLKRA